jgi:hypothetical protein
VKIELAAVPRCRGVYDIDRDGTKAEMPKRALWLAPDAAECFDRHLAGVLVVSDMFRSPDSSLAAVRSGRGAAAPGRSSHNYGRAIDVDVDAALEETGHKTKVALDAWLASLGWHCWRDDHAMPSWRPINEAWHYFWAPGGARYVRGSAVQWWADEMLTVYPAKLTEVDAQSCLATLGLYSGGLDGKFGTLSRRALEAFQRGWGRRATGWLDDDTMRCLAYVAWHKQWADARR